MRLKWPASPDARELGARSARQLATLNHEQNLKLAQEKLNREAADLDGLRGNEAPRRFDGPLDGGFLEGRLVCARKERARLEGGLVGVGCRTKRRTIRR
jgi:hypothetical protein